MSDNIDVPKIGPVNKKVVIGVGGAAAVFIAWRWYAARAGDTADTAVDTTADEYADGGVLPSVSGAVSPSNSYGYPDTSTGSGSTVDSYGFTGTTNAQWTQYVTTQLVQSDTWSYTEIVTALGNYLNNRSLTSTQQSIVQAAIALAGYAPEGSHVIISGGNTTIAVAPTGVKVTATTANSVSLSWSSVSGAASYEVYRSGATGNAIRSSGTSTTISGLQSNTSYSFQVAAVSSAGSAGPKSSSVTGKTKAVTLTKPTGLKSSAITKSSFTVSCSKVTGATNYRWYLNGSLKGSTDAPTFSFTGLKAKTRYRITVKADVYNQSPGPDSSPLYVTTKSK